MSFPSAPEFLLSLLRAAERGQSAASLCVHLEHSLATGDAGLAGPLTPELRGQLGEAVRQATQSLAAAGLLQWTDDGLWYATERGRQVTSAGLALALPAEEAAAPAPAAEPAAARPRRYRGGNRSRAARQEALLAAVADALPPDTLRQAAEAADAALARALLARLRERPPAFLEGAVLALLGAMGYGTPQPRPPFLRKSSGDGGIDGILAADALGLERVAVQTKRYAEDMVVGVRSVRDFYAALEHAQARKGVIAATALFSKEARETAAALAKPMVLLDGPALARLMIRHQVGCRVEATYSVTAIDEGFFAAA